jgi:hypothetical protein
VPSAAVQTVETEAVSDSWFLGIPGAGSLSVGRLPVSTVAETQAVVAKILGRREATARSPWLLVSDARGTSDFPEFTADLRTALPDAAATVLVRGSDTDDVIHQRFLDAARTGPALVSFMGHAAEEFWTEATPAIYAAEDVPALAGSNTSLWMDLTCWTGFFQDPRRQSLAVSTLLAPSGGAWATWASTGGSYPGTHSAFGQALAKSLLVDGKTLGEATRDALAVSSEPDVQSTFALLGDPSSRAVATQTQALQTRSSASSGCTAAPSAPGALAALLALAAWLAGIRPGRARRCSGH